jgi:rhodanese-related sulfurtransferase
MRSPAITARAQEPQAMPFADFVIKYWYLSVLALVLSIALASTYLMEFRFGPVLVSPTEVTRLINRERALVLDVQVEADYAGGHIPGAVACGPSPEAERLKALLRDKARPVVLYSGKDVPTMVQCQVVLAQGVERVYRLRGGLQGWRAEGFPIGVAGEG